jgi:hypothetical protein
MADTLTLSDFAGLIDAVDAEIRDRQHQAARDGR